MVKLATENTKHNKLLIVCLFILTVEIFLLFDYQFVSVWTIVCLLHPDPVWVLAGGHGVLQLARAAQHLPRAARLPHRTCAV